MVLAQSGFTTQSASVVKIISPFAISIPFAIARAFPTTFLNSLIGFIVLKFGLSEINSLMIFSVLSSEWSLTIIISNLSAG